MIDYSRIEDGSAKWAETKEEIWINNEKTLEAFGAACGDRAAFKYCDRTAWQKVSSGTGEVHIRQPACVSAEWAAVACAVFAGVFY